jgi:ATP-dependent Clp protease ATP-binding subunit ClpC
MVELAPDVRALLAQAQRVAQRHGARTSTGHLVLAMLESQGDTAHVLEGHGARAVALYEALKQVEREADNAIELCLERARRIAVHSGSRKARPLHVLLAALQNARHEAHRGLSALGVPVEVLRQTLEDSLGLRSKQPPSAGLREPREAPARIAADALKPLPRTLIDWEAQKRVQSGASAGSAADPRAATPRAMRRQAAPAEPLKTPPGVNAEAPREALPTPVAAAPAEPFRLDEREFPLLSSLGKNLSLEASQGRIDPVVGRDAEIEQVLDVLARRRANNPILVGPPGVGKTAIAEGLALRLLEESGPLREKMLIELSAGSLVSGTGVRGALAEKLARLRKEVRASQGRVLLFLDEIHALVGGGEGPDDLGNELKAALARGELPCVGATTEAEYRRVFERDAALSRRFTRVEVREPTRDQALAIVRGLALHYERFHGVAYADDALCAAVDLSIRYLPEQHLPDKAIGLVDRAGARQKRRGADVVDLGALAAVLSEQASVPVERLLMRDREQLLKLEAQLEERVIGQREAIARISECVRKGAVGLRGPRPLGVFLFSGPTGVGKTELAKALSDALFTSTGMTRLDMSEYAESHATARLFGAPPGYVGFEEGGQLTEAVRKRPYQLVLLDEVEKAHPDVLLALLPLLDEGRLTDGRGRTVDFTNTVIVMTSNLGARATTREAIGFGSESRVQASSAVTAVRRALPPELYNRIDEVVVFPALSRADVARIAQRMLAQVVNTLRREHGVEIDIEDSVVDALVEAGGYDPELGARPMRRTVSREVEAPLARLLLQGEAGRGDRLLLAAEDGRVTIRPLGAPRLAAADA